MFAQIRAMLVIAIVLGTAMMFAGCESNVEKYRKQGVALYKSNQYDQSQQTLDRALSYDQFDAVSNTYEGLIYYRQAKYEQAAYSFKVALESDPSSEEAKEGLTATYIKMGKPDLAVDFLERQAAVAEKVDDPRWKRSYANRRFQEETEENLYTGKAADRYRIGRTYLSLGDYDNALVYFNKALELAPKSGVVLLAIGELYEKTGNKDMARDYLIRAYNVQPGTPGLTAALTRNNIPISKVIGTH